MDPDYTATVGLAWALVAAADADTGAQALRAAAVVRLLLHNALRADEACAADVADLGEDSGHRVLRVVRKGGRKAEGPQVGGLLLEALAVAGGSEGPSAASATADLAWSCQARKG